jgi:hypothetical protein
MNQPANAGNLPAANEIYSDKRFHPQYSLNQLNELSQTIKEIKSKMVNVYGAGDSLPQKLNQFVTACNLMQRIWMPLTGELNSDWQLSMSDVLKEYLLPLIGDPFDGAAYYLEGIFVVMPYAISQQIFYKKSFKPMELPDSAYTNFLKFIDSERLNEFTVDDFEFRRESLMNFSIYVKGQKLDLFSFDIIENYID